MRNDHSRGRDQPTWLHINSRMSSLASYVNRLGSCVRRCPGVPYHLPSESLNRWHLRGVEATAGPTSIMDARDVRTIREQVRLSRTWRRSKLTSKFTGLDGIRRFHLSRICSSEANLTCEYRLTSGCRTNVKFKSSTITINLLVDPVARTLAARPYQADANGGAEPREHCRARWTPVRMKTMRGNKDCEHCR